MRSRHYYGKHRIWVHSTKYLVREGPETLSKNRRRRNEHGEKN